MDDDLPTRHRADQPGEDYPDDRRYHDWSDIEGTVPRPPLRVIRSEDTPEHAPAAPGPSEAVTAAMPEPPAEQPTEPARADRKPDVVAGIRAYVRKLGQLLDDEQERQQERPPWER